MKIFSCHLIKRSRRWFMVPALAAACSLSSVRPFWMDRLEYSQLSRREVVSWRTEWFTYTSDLSINMYRDIDAITLRPKRDSWQLPKASWTVLDIYFAGFSNQEISKVDSRKARCALWPLEFLLHRWPHWHLHGFLENIFANGRLAEAEMISFTGRFRQYSHWPLKNWKAFSSVLVCFCCERSDVPTIGHLGTWFS